MTQRGLAAGDAGLCIGVQRSGPRNRYRLGLEQPAGLVDCYRREKPEHRLTHNWEKCIWKDITYGVIVISEARKSRLEESYHGVLHLGSGPDEVVNLCNFDRSFAT